MDGKVMAMPGEGNIPPSVISQLAKFDIRLKKDYPEISKGKTFRRAAVLLPITVRNGELHILLTKRSPTLRTHPSTVSLPGGIRDNTDVSDIDTALREAEEEIGLPRACVQVLAVLDRGITLPNIVVYPVVGYIPSDFVPEINPNEVQEAFYIPLQMFVSSKVDTYSFKMFGKSFETRSLNYDNGDTIFVIWGFTAIQCVILARMLYDQNPEEIISMSKMYFDHIFHHVQLKSMNKL